MTAANKINGHHAPMPAQAKQHDQDTPSWITRLLHDDPEGWCRLRGLQAMLALPPTNQRRRVVEVEVERGVWEPIDELSIDPEHLVLAQSGAELAHIAGELMARRARLEWRIVPSSGIPQWRMAARGVREHFADYRDPTREAGP